MEDPRSISISLSRNSVLEGMSMYRASLDDAASRLADGADTPAISNEQICSGDVILDTYSVTSDAISGGMGSVWRVHHRYWDTDLAMKRPQPRFFAEGSRERKETFIRECENWISLGLHPNIVSCYYVREIGGVPTIFSEWMDGGSLGDRIRDGSLYAGTEEEVQERLLDIAVQSARGLQYSHEKGLIHQDMKPGNLLLSRDWEAKVADFGLSKARSELVPSGAAGTGYTPAYCPREQSEGEEAQRWMDVYAWALTVLAMYAGERLWETGAEAKDIFDRCLSGCKYSVPGSLASVLRSCLTEKPDGFSGITDSLTSLYLERFAKPYPRFLPDADLLTADNNNNYALSMIELGKEAPAAELWDESLKVQPDHVQSRINKTFYDFLGSRISYDQAFSTIGKIPYEEERKAAARTLRIEGSGLEALCEIPDEDQAVTSHGDWNGIAESKIEMLSLPVIFDGKGSFWLFRQNRLHRYDCGHPDGTYAESVECAQVIADADAEKFYAVTELREEIGSVSFARTEIGGSGITENVLLTWDYEFLKCLMTDFADDRQKSRKHYVSQARSNVYVRENPLRSEIKGIWYEDQGKRLCILRLRDLMENSDMAQADVATAHIIETYEMDTAYGTGGKMIQMSAVDGVPAGCQAAHLTKNNPFFTVEPQKRISRAESTPEKLIDRKQDNRAAELQVSIAGVSPCEPLCAAVVYTGEKQNSYRVYLCRVIGPGFRHAYLLSRFALIDRVQQLNAEASRTERLFDESVRRKDYRQAVELYRRYRDMEYKADAEATIRMEKEIAKVCRRVGVHHLTVEDRTPFVPAREYFTEKSYPYNSNSTQKRRILDEAKQNSAEKEVKAYYHAMKHLRIRKEDRQWLKSLRDSFSTFYLSYLRPRGNFGYVKVLTSDNEKRIALRLDLRKKDLTILQKSKDDRSAAEEWNTEDKWVLGRFINSDCKTMSPDGSISVRFCYDDILYKTANAGKVLWLGKRLMKMSDSEKILFSRDGFLIRIGSPAAPLCCRICWDYEFPGFSDWDGRADFYAEVFLSDCPEWSEDQFEGFMQELSVLGLGYLRRDSVRKKLEEMKRRAAGG